MIDLYTACCDGHRAGKLEVAGQVRPCRPWLGAVGFGALVETLGAGQELFALGHAVATEQGSAAVCIVARGEGEQMSEGDAGARVGCIGRPP